MDKHFLVFIYFAGEARQLQAVNSDPDLDGAGRGWSGLVGAAWGYIHSVLGSWRSWQSAGLGISRFWVQSRPFPQSMLHAFHLPLAV